MGTNLSKRLDDPNADLYYNQDKFFDDAFDIALDSKVTSRLCGQPNTEKIITKEIIIHYRKIWNVKKLRRY